jgi:RpiR family carbohydrate utilization transcriptional regulator
VAITGFMKSPLTQVADFCLLSCSRETHYRPEAMSSQLSQLAIIDTLVVAVSLRLKDVAFDKLQKIRQAIANKRF